jgi:hypothetical protein
MTETCSRIYKIRNVCNVMLLCVIICMYINHCEPGVRQLNAVFSEHYGCNLLHTSRFKLFFFNNSHPVVLVNIQ